MERKVKIVHIAKLLAGVGTSIQLIAENINEAKFELVLIRDIEENPRPLLYKSGKEVKTYAFDLQREIQPINDLKFLSQAIKIIKQEQPHLIHCHSAKGGVIGRTLGSIVNIPTFFTPQAFSFLSVENTLKRSVYRKIEQVYSLTNSYLVACSNSEADRALKETNYPKNRIYVVDNFLSESVKEPNIAVESDYICTIGRPSYQKNSLYLLKVFKEIHKINPYIKLYMLGVGYYSPELMAVQRYIEDNGLSNVVKLFKWTSREETLAILRNSLLYLSFSRYEGLSFAVLEAMAFGIPCVLSDVDGNKDCLKEGKGGLLIESNSLAHDVAEKILPLLLNKEERYQMGQAAYQQFLKFFTAKENIYKLEELYIKHAKKGS